MTSRDLTPKYAVPHSMVIEAGVCHKDANIP
jgi:hypothetical protein